MCHKQEVTNVSVSSSLDSTNSMATDSQHKINVSDSTNSMVIDSQHEINASDSTETLSATKLATQTCAEPKSKRKQVKDGNIAFSIVYTATKKEASNFYLKPIVQSSSRNDEYFHIVTDPEDYQRTMDKENEQVATSQSDSPTEGASNEPEIDDKQARKKESEIEQPSNLDASQGGESICKHMTLYEDQRDEPQRYVTVINRELVVGLNIKRHMKNAKFKLKNLHEETEPFTKSQWLPKALRGSQPHILFAHKSAFSSRKSRSVYINLPEPLAETQDKKIYYGKNKHKGYRYFILEDGHYT